MEMKFIQAKATNLINLLSSCSILMPFSGQGNLQIDVPLTEYVLFTRSMCEADKFLYNAIAPIEKYKKALGSYDEGNRKPISVLFTFDLHVAGIMELKKAVSRGKRATLITLDYVDEDSPYLAFNEMFSMLESKFQSDRSRELVIKTIQSMNRTYNSIPIDVNHLDEHNKLYYAYIALLHYNIQAASGGNKFNTFHINI